MNVLRSGAAIACVCLLLPGCGKEPGSKTLTRGTTRAQCDEAVAPVMIREVSEFERQYTDARVLLRTVEGREAIANFAMDSVRVIVVARALNKEERDALAAAKIDVKEYHVAQAAVAVVVNKKNPVQQLGLSELDSIFTGRRTAWQMKGKGVIEPVIGGVNSSVNEVFRGQVLGGSKFALSATPIESSRELLEYVGRTPGAIGIVGAAWLKGSEETVRVLSIGGPRFQPDTTAAPGQYYSPAQAYVYQGFYPICCPVYMYSRETSIDISVGFISFVSSGPGQKVVLDQGLVPVTMPVRLVQLTSEQVKEG